MKIKIFQDTDMAELERALNAFDETHNVKFTQHSSAAISKSEVAVTVLVFHEGPR